MIRGVAHVWIRWLAIIGWRISVFGAFPPSSARTAAVEAGEATAAAGQPATAASHTAPDDGDGDQDSDDNSNDGGQFAVGLLHAIVPAREGLGHIFDIIDGVGHGHSSWLFSLYVERVD